MTEKCTSREMLSCLHDLHSGGRVWYTTPNEIWLICKLLEVIHNISLTGTSRKQAAGNSMTLFFLTLAQPEKHKVLNRVHLTYGLWLLKSYKHR